MDMRGLVGRNLLKIRLEKGLSQEELAARAGFNQHYISEMEAGKRNPTITSLYEIAEGLGVEPVELVKFTEGAKPKRRKR
jgi:transcriptional regulator with XRE-family HTH domain